MLNPSVKYVLGGVAVAAVISAGLFFTLPKDYEEGTHKVNAQTEDYSRTIYGVPDLKLHSYRISEDKYFDLVLDGTLDVGRSNPVAQTVWYKKLVKDPKIATKNANLRERITVAIAKSDSDTLTDSLESILAEEVSKQKAKEAQVKALKEIEEKAKADALLEETKAKEGEVDSETTDTTSTDGSASTTPISDTEDSSDESSLEILTPAIDQTSTTESDTDDNTKKDGKLTTSSTTESAKDKTQTGDKVTTEIKNSTDKAKTSGADTSISQDTQVKGVSDEILNYAKATAKLVDGANSVYDAIEQIKNAKALPSIYISMLESDYLMVTSMGTNIQNDKLKDVKMYSFYEDGFNRFDTMLNKNKAAIQKAYNKKVVSELANTSKSLHALAKGYDDQSSNKKVNIKKLQKAYKSHIDKLKEYGLSE